VALQEPSPPGRVPGARHRVRLPRFLIREPVGLGDLVKRGTSVLGGGPCPVCERRAERLNRWLRFDPRA
jgi:hypothetical protein